MKGYTKEVITTFIALSFLFPAFASASTKPPKDTTPPSIVALHISSSNANPAIAVPGDTVSLSFTTSEKVQTPVVLVNARPLFLRAANSTGNNWVATYTVVAKDPLGKAAWAIGLADIANNVYACTSPRFLIIPYCPSTDGSSVVISKPVAPPPPPDTVPPVISAHANVSVSTTNPAGTAVTYSLPTATDNVDGTDTVSCTPTSGSTFAIGTTTVNCSAHDAAGNTATSSFKVGVALTVVPPPPDTTAPVIAPHADVFATTTDTSAAVTYSLPTATDNVDGTDAVSCTPASGSTFALGSTTVNCSAQDVAGNIAHSSFVVGVTQVVPPPPPGPYTMASQPDESFFCGGNPNDFTGTWRACDNADTFGFTPDLDTPTATIDIDPSSVTGTGVLQTITIAKDKDASSPFFPWLITISCYTDSARTQACTDWQSLSQPASQSADGIHWSANFIASSATLDASHYYRLVIDDTGQETAAYGSFSLRQPYWLITGLH